MAGSGIAWGFYSLLGKKVATPLATTAASFIRAVPLALAALLVTAVTSQSLRWDSYTIALSLASGGLASGLGYAIWYAALPDISATHAAVIQLAVPPLAASGGVMLLGERPTIALAASAAAILTGIALAVVGVRSPVSQVRTSGHGAENK
jgi:drug/metabolite transporter (DMT)-like permease